MAWDKKKLYAEDFNPRAPYGARRMPHSPGNSRIAISIHAPHTGHDVEGEGIINGDVISIHAPHTGHDFSASSAFSSSKLFQSTRPIRGTTVSDGLAHGLNLISIHAPHTGHDCCISSTTSCIFDFNPRAPYGARPHRYARHGFQHDFNPRAPYGARPGANGGKCDGCCISIHAPHTGHDILITIGAIKTDISIHAPHTGHDAIRCCVLDPPHRFQSTRPIRGTTEIHFALNVGKIDFNPRAPYGARRDVGDNYDVIPVFQSTRPIRGTTYSPTVPCPSWGYFNPRAPYGARLVVQELYNAHKGFQSTRPIRGTTLPQSPPCLWLWYFNPRAPYGARRKDISNSPPHAEFQSTRPIRGTTAA